jgi:hypothetical protein
MLSTSSSSTNHDIDPINKKVFGHLISELKIISEVRNNSEVTSQKISEILSLVMHFPKVLENLTFVANAKKWCRYLNSCQMQPQNSGRLGSEQNNFLFLSL